MGRLAGEMAELELRLKPLAGSRSSRPLGRPNARNSEILVVLTWLRGPRLWLRVANQHRACRGRPREPRDVAWKGPRPGLACLTLRGLPPEFSSLTRAEMTSGASTGGLEEKECENLDDGSPDSGTVDG